MDYEPWSVVVVPFPFTDSPRARRRPALVLSSTAEQGGLVGHSVLAMITSARNSRWPLDVAIDDLPSAGLEAASVVRMKLFTLDHRFILRSIGALSEQDRGSVGTSLKKLLPGV
ncbi:MAG: type II toxin-antitoxin system PemK/MazF family toxin [Thermoleophilia bacterium]|nr:type II toxin-antitoxin system PemK/MazF family toxin [Thermoleophilia bacterium]